MAPLYGWTRSNRLLSALRHRTNDSDPTEKLQQQRMGTRRPPPLNVSDRPWRRTQPLGGDPTSCDDRQKNVAVLAGWSTPAFEATRRISPLALQTAVPALPGPLRATQPKGSATSPSKRARTSAPSKSASATLTASSLRSSELSVPSDASVTDSIRTNWSPNRSA